MNSNKNLLNEIHRYNNINKYILEQEGGETAPADDMGLGLDTPPPAGDEGLGTETPPTEGGADEIPEPVDVSTDPDVEVVNNDGTTEQDSDTSTDDSGTEELDITDLVTSQKEISDKQDEYMETMFSKLDDLTSKLSEMDSILDKINNLETKIEKYREKSPEEKLQLRSLDSYPYNQKLTDFFMDKQDEFEKTGKNEYVLTSDDVENFSDSDIKKSFDKPFEDEEFA